MSLKDVKDYYDTLQKQYTTMLKTLSKAEKSVAHKEISEEKYKEIKNSVETIKSTYMNISYIIFLLNQPVKKSKISRYKSQNKKLLESSINPIPSNNENLKNIEDNIL